MRKSATALLLLALFALQGCRWVPLPKLTRGASPQAAVTVVPTNAAQTAGGESRARPSRPTAPTAARSAEATGTIAPVLPAKQEILDAFREIAFSSEYGGSSGQIRKWTAKVNVAVHGSPTAEDGETLSALFTSLNAVGGFPGIGPAEGEPNMDVWFVPLGEMPGVIPGYVEGNWGFFTTQYDHTGITRVQVAVATDVTAQDERNHLIQEEIIQACGLMQDTYAHPDSIFYGEWTTVQSPSPMDWELIGILYMPALAHGMPEGEAMDWIEEHYTPPAGA